MQKLSKGQRDLLMFGAITGPMAITCGGKSLLWAVPAIAGAWLIYAVVRKKLPEGHGLAEYMPVWLLIPELLFLILAAAKAASLVSLCWSEEGAWPLFSLTLLVLAAAAAYQNTDGVGRCSVLLGLACAVFYGTAFGAAALEQNKTIEFGKWTDGIPVMITALSGVCGMFLPSQKGGTKFWIGVSVFVSLLLFGTNGKNGALPTLTAIKGITLYGAFQRFEAIAACVITVGLFLMLALLTAAGNEIVKQLEIPQVKGFAVIVPAGAIIWWIEEVSGVIMGAGAVLFWGIVPLTTQAVVGQRSRGKKEKKREKRG